MIKVCTIVLLSAGVLACSPERQAQRPSADSTAIVAEIEGIIEELAEALVRGDAAEVYNCYTTSDFVFTSAAGHVSTREQMLDELWRGSVKFESFYFTNDVIQIHGDVVVTMGLGSGEGINPGGERFRGEHRYLAVFVHVDNRWLLSAWQTTMVREH